MAQNEKNYERAKERVENRIRFLIHAGVYLVVNAGLMTLNLVNSPDKIWFIWPLAGWGIGLLFHTWKVFGADRSSNWKEKMIEKEQSKLK